MIALADTPIHVAAVEAAVTDPACGAVVTFVGRVRDHHQGRAVDHLEYEAYEPMAVAQMQAVVAEARERWQLGPVAMVHRVGRLAIGDVAVAIAVAAGHRGEAFEACRYLIDRIKQVVPIWKHEFWADGSSEWVGPDTAPTEAT